MTDGLIQAMYIFFSKDVKFPLMLDVYELCTSELQEKMLPIRSKFKDVEDKKLEKQQQKVMHNNDYSNCSFHLYRQSNNQLFMSLFYSFCIS